MGVKRRSALSAWMQITSDVGALISKERREDAGAPRVGVLIDYTARGNSPNYGRATVTCKVYRLETIRYITGIRALAARRPTRRCNTRAERNLSELMKPWS